MKYSDMKREHIFFFVKEMRFNAYLMCVVRIKNKIREMHNLKFKSEF